MTYLQSSNNSSKADVLALEAIPTTWGGLFKLAIKAPINWLETRYTKWIKYLVLQRVEQLARLEAAAHNDSFTSASEALYSMARETESPAEKAAKDAWTKLQAQHRIQARMQEQGQEIRQQVNNMYQLQQAMHQRIRANGVGRAQSQSFSS